MDVRNSASLVDVENFDPSYLLIFFWQRSQLGGAVRASIGGILINYTSQRGQCTSSINCDRCRIRDDRYLKIGWTSTNTLRIYIVELELRVSIAQGDREGMFRRRADARSCLSPANNYVPPRGLRRIDVHHGEVPYWYRRGEFVHERQIPLTEQRGGITIPETVLVASDGVVTDFQIHARIAVLGKSSSPADNRKVPPLRYHHARRLAQEFPELSISLNGGVDTLSGVKRELDECGALEGVMVGRGFVANPWAFAMTDEVLYPDMDHLLRPKNRVEVLEAYGQHVDFEEDQWEPIKIRPFLTKATDH
ncbi:LOW QUALITY PROTEIN: hypothetical protein ACHAWF_006866, partial [Thalassiosira exigua]